MHGDRKGQQEHRQARHISWAQRNTVVTAIFSEMYFFAVLNL